MLWLQENINKNIKKYAVSFIWVKAKQLIIKTAWKEKYPLRNYFTAFKHTYFFNFPKISGLSMLYSSGKEWYKVWKYILT